MGGICCLCYCLADGIEHIHLHRTSNSILCAQLFGMGQGVKVFGLEGEAEFFSIMQSLNWGAFPLGNKLSTMIRLVDVSTSTFSLSINRLHP